MTILNFTSANPSLAKVQLIPSAQNWVNLCVRHLPDNQQQETYAMLRAINSDVFDSIENKDQINISLLRYKEKTYSKAYPMSLETYEGQLVVKLNRETVAPITPEVIDELMGEFNLAQVEAYEEPCLTLTLESEDADVWVTKMLV